MPGEGTDGLRLEMLNKRVQIIWIYIKGTNAMVMVRGLGLGSINNEKFALAYDIANPILDELSYRYDQSLPIAQSITIGIPSGEIRSRYYIYPDTSMLDLNTPPEGDPALAETLSLYREGISSNNPFHQFLSLWKAYENCAAVRRNWRKSIGKLPTDRRWDIGEEGERIPNKFAFYGYQNKKFDDVIGLLAPAHRHALAHGELVDGQPRISSRAKDIHDVMIGVPIIRHMARVIIRNTRACLALPLPK